MIYPWLKEYWSLFQDQLSTDRLSHALMLVGPSGIGKLDLANAMVANLLCLEPGATGACGVCKSCKLLEGGAHPDRFELQPEEDSEIIKVDQVRALISSLNLTTSISERKVACIHPADVMNIASSNALLKCLEEPAGDTVLILVCDDMSRLPVTVASRCQSILLKQPEHSTSVDWIVAQNAGSAQDAEIAVKAAGGSPLRALGYMEGEEGQAFNEVQTALATLTSRPALVSSVTSGLDQLPAKELWRWLSLCAADATKSLMTGQAPAWLPADGRYNVKRLLELQKSADSNRIMSASSVRKDLLLQSWLIRWVEQAI